MVMIVYRSRFLRIGESWFVREPTLRSDVDVVHLRSMELPTKGGCSNEFSTLTVDLRREPEDLERRMNQTTRYEVRRALARDNFTASLTTAPTESDIQTFADDYRFNPASDAAPSVLDRLDRYGSVGMLALSVVTKDAAVLARHAYIFDSRDTRLLYAVQILSSETREDRAWHSRANRMLHWIDMLRFRELGIERLDMGGWSGQSADPKLRAVSAFKAGFGGSISTRYDCVVPVTARGRLVDLIATWRDRAQVGRP